MKVNGFCYEMHFQCCIPLQKVSYIFLIKIEIFYEAITFVVCMTCSKSEKCIPSDSVKSKHKTS